MPPASSRASLYQLHMTKYLGGQGCRGFLVKGIKAAFSWQLQFRDCNQFTLGGGLILTYCCAATGSLQFDANAAIRITAAVQSLSAAIVSSKPKVPRHAGAGHRRAALSQDAELLRGALHALHGQRFCEPFSERLKVKATVLPRFQTSRHQERFVTPFA